MIDFEELWKISHNTPILKVLDYYNIDYQTSGYGRYKCVCPFHDDHNPSLLLYVHEDGQNDSFCCYVDNNAGDSFRFIQLMEGDFRNSWNVLCEINGIVNVDFDNLDLLEQQIKIEEKKVEEVSTQAYNRQISALYREFLLEQKNDVHMCAEVDKRFKVLDDILSNNPAPAEMRQFFHHELQLLTLLKNTHK